MTHTPRTIGVIEPTVLVNNRAATLILEAGLTVGLVAPYDVDASAYGVVLHFRDADHIAAWADFLDAQVVDRPGMREGDRFYEATAQAFGTTVSVQGLVRAERPAVPLEVVR